MLLACEINEYLKNLVFMKSLINDSAITCDEIDMLQTVSIYSISKRHNNKWVIIFFLLIY